MSGSTWIALVLGFAGAAGLLLRYLTRHDNGYVVIAWDDHGSNRRVVGCYSWRSDARRHAASLERARVVHAVGTAWHDARRGVVPPGAGR